MSDKVDSYSSESLTVKKKQREEKKVEETCGCKATVLIVEDNHFNVNPIRMILRCNYEIEIDVAKDGATSVSMVQKNLKKKCCDIRYQMILMDLHMPVMDGFTAV